MSLKYFAQTYIHEADILMHAHITDSQPQFKCCVAYDHDEVDDE